MTIDEEIKILNMYGTVLQGYSHTKSTFNAVMRIDGMFAVKSVGNTPDDAIRNMFKLFNDYLWDEVNDHHT